MHSVSEVHGHTVLTVTDGVALGSEAAAVDLIGEAFGAGAGVVVVPVERVDPAFFELRSRVAGDVVLKFAGYRIRLVVLGDLGERLAASESLAAFVRETDRGRDIWFPADREVLVERLRTVRPTTNG